MQVNARAPRSQIGAVNGIGQGLASGVRGLGPALGGWLWSLSQASGLPGHQFFVFMAIACVAAAGHGVYSSRALLGSRQSAGP